MKWCPKDWIKVSNALNPLGDHWSTATTTDLFWHNLATFHSPHIWVQCLAPVAYENHNAVQSEMAKSFLCKC